MLRKSRSLRQSRENPCSCSLCGGKPPRIIKTARLIERSGKDDGRHLELPDCSITTTSKPTKTSTTAMTKTTDPKAFVSLDSYQQPTENPMLQQNTWSYSNAVRDQRPTQSHLPPPPQSFNDIFSRMFSLYELFSQLKIILTLYLPIL